MKLYYKLSAALLVIAATASLALSFFFIKFQERELVRTHKERAALLISGTRDILSEAELAADPLMVVDYLSDLLSSRPELAGAELDLGRGFRPIKPRRTPARLRRAPPPAPLFWGRGKLPSEKDKIINRTSPAKRAGPAKNPVEEIHSLKYAARLEFDAAYLESEVRARLTAVYRDLSIAFLCSLFVSAGAGFALSYHLTRRLKRLSAAASAVGEGRFGAEIEARGSDEIAELARTFNAMSARLLELEAMKKNFISSITHELRSPLGAIESYVELLLRDGRAWTRRELSDLARIKTNASRLSNFVTVMLDLAKIERGKMELRLSNYEPGALIEDLAAFFGSEAAKKGVKLTVDISGCRGPMLLDRELTTHALTNLVSNALKFTPAGKEVGISAFMDGEKLRVEVRDEGPGIEPEEIKGLFSVFGQTARGAQKKGTGLGLALSKAIVELHKGRIGAGAAPEGGALFWFEVPRNINP
ncbi:MAG: HAMP domain-containing sensor histidine kinase [Elusimicrobia bacterium]|nr:HAMP domain-containing sensor histidine kinase [Elusimicrobiota bacterium]